MNEPKQVGEIYLFYTEEKLEFNEYSIAINQGARSLYYESHNALGHRYLND